MKHDKRLEDNLIRWMNPFSCAGRRVATIGKPFYAGKKINLAETNKCDTYDNGLSGPLSANRLFNRILRLSFFRTPIGLVATLSLHSLAVQVTRHISAAGCKPTKVVTV
jgi:hypothetical protein